MNFFSVAQITQKLKASLETNFSTIGIIGEVSGVKTTVAGHTYFTLKDEKAQLNCAWFNGKILRQNIKSARNATEEFFDQKTGEFFRTAYVTPEQLKKGGSFVCFGTISFYPSGGTCQLLVDTVVSYGEASLALAFEAKKKELAKQGYFAKERKRPIPKNPQRIALITSDRGAAIKDFLSIANSRGFGCEIRLFPSLVQGKEAAPALLSAFENACAQNWAQVVVVIRGGGSIEDLWCFNEESVAKAIFLCPIPVVAGIGHEIDVTLADLTADLRAATPTHAAELLWEPRMTFVQDVQRLFERLTKTVARVLTDHAQRLEHEIRALFVSSPQNRLHILEERFAMLNKAFRMSGNSFLVAKERLYFPLQTRFLACMAPERLDSTIATITFFRQKLFRLLEKELGIRERLLLACRQSLESFMDPHRLEAKMERLTLFRQKLASSFENTLVRYERDLASLTERLDHAVQTLLASIQAQIATATALLQTNSPLSLLERGYALVFDEKSALVKSVDLVAVGQTLTLSLYDGTITVTVQKKENNTQR